MAQSTVASPLGCFGIDHARSSSRPTLPGLESVLTFEGTSGIRQLVIGQALTGHAAFR